MKKGQGKLIFAILVIALVGQINTIASVMIADLATAFPTASPVALQYVMQFGMIGGFPVSLAMTVLSQKFRKKPMILLGMVLILIGGAVPIFVHSSLAILYVCAFIVGAGQGFITPLLGTIILLNFEGTLKDRILGLNTTFGTGGAALLLMVAGWVCKTGWVHVYYIYFFVIPVFIVALLCLPMDEVPKADPSASGPKAAIPGKGVIQCCIAVLMFIAYAVFPLNLALYVTEYNVGDSAAVGLGMSLVTIVGALIGLILPQITKMFKLYIGTLAAVFGFLATFCVIIAKNIAMIYVASVLDGIFFGVMMAGGGYVIGRICRPEQIGPTFSLSMSFVTLGTIFSPIIINFLNGIWGGAKYGTKGSFITAAAIFVVVIVLQIIWGTYLTKTCPPEVAPAAPQEK